MKKAIVFAGSDGHGATMGIISCRNLEKSGYEVALDCRWPQTGKPSQFWGETFLKAEYDGIDLVVAVDLPLPEYDGTYPNAVSDAVRKIRELTDAGVQVVIVDHHKVAETHYGKARVAGAKVVVTSTATTCYWGSPTPFAEKWGRLGAICDLDDAVLPVTEDEERLALGLDALVRSSLSAALEAISRDDTAYFAEKGLLPAIPGAVQLVGDVVSASALSPTWGFKQLSRAAQDAGVDYAVGVDCFSGYWRVIAITNWKRDVLPVALKLGLTRFIGHGAAILVAVSPETDTEGEAKARAKAAEFTRRLNGEAQPPVVENPNGGKNGSGDIFAYVSRFMREAEIPFFLTQHGWPHVQRVVGHARSLGSLMGLTEHQQVLLDWSAVFHDVGNAAGPAHGIGDEEARARHHEFSRDSVLEWGNKGLFDGILDNEDVEAVADICFRHRKKVDLPQDSERRLLTILLRVADGIDLDARRAQRNDEGKFFEDLDLPEDSIPHWEGHRAIEALRISAENGHLVFEIIVTDAQKAAFQVAEVTKELAVMTELTDWDVRVIAARDDV